MRPLFRITNPHAFAQLGKVHKILNKHLPYVLVVYQSNYYIVIACTDFDIACTVMAQLHRINPDWDIDDRPGRKRKYHYLKLTFIKE